MSHSSELSNLVGEWGVTGTPELGKSDKSAGNRGTPSVTGVKVRAVLWE